MYTILHELGTVYLHKPSTCILLEKVLIRTVLGTACHITLILPSLLDCGDPCAEICRSRSGWLGGRGGVESVLVGDLGGSSGGGRLRGKSSAIQRSKEPFLSVELMFCN